MKKLILTASVLSILAGCASRPESIPASYVAHERYAMHNCQKLSELKMDTVSRLLLASDQQDADANADAVGVFLILIPFSAFSGDHEAEVANLKGEVQAIETAQAVNECSYSKYVVKKKVIETESTNTTDDFLKN